MKICPQCGHLGDLEFCPNDGARLSPVADTPAERATPPIEPTASMRGDEPLEDTLLPGAPAAHEHPSIARVRRDEDEALRDADFGQWRAPKVKKSKDPMIGRLINDRYQVIGLLGEGGMGAVYKAYQPKVQRMIALKVLLQRFAQNEVAAKRFHQEALAASRLRHPHTIDVYDFGQTEDGVLYMAMEYLRGQSLAHLLERRGVLPQARAIKLLKQVCKSLSEAHKAGIIHRDLKPDNIFLTDIEGEGDFIKVLDFGVAKLKEFDGKEGTLTEAGMIFGTPKYMSPEQASSVDLDARSDIYALGAILYEMITGRPPFIADHPLSILVAHINQAVIPPREVAPEREIHPALERLILKALSKAPAARQGDIGRLLEELEAVEIALETGQTQTAMALGLLERGDLVKAPRRGARWGIALGLLVALGMGGEAWRRVREQATSTRLSSIGEVSAAQSTLDAAAKDTAATKDAALKDAATKDASVKDIALKDAAPCVTFDIKSHPRRAQLIDLKRGAEVGQTPQAVCIHDKTQYELKRGGYQTLKFSLEATDKERQLTFTLKPLPGVKPPKPPSIRFVKTKPIEQHLEPSAKVKVLAKKPTEADIDLQ
ncbi:serine/threonine protein kinase [Myxococcota bacterium]|nr:serine/threonine protein kinase [Myxococcota bacterium]